MATARPLLELTAYTDPYCTWCWGSEPVLRRIQEVFGDQVSIDFVMGGLVKDIDQFRDPANGIGGPGWEHQVAAHWAEASKLHGMPVDADKFPEHVAMQSTYPASIAYEAAKLQDPEIAKRYLRRLRESAAAEGRAIHLREVQAELADEVGLDRARFLDDLDGRARDVFEADLDECASRGVRGFPTFLVRTRDGRERLMRGYQGYDAFATVFAAFAGEELETRRPTFSDGAVLTFVDKYGSAAPREVAEVFDVSDAQAEAALRRLAGSGLAVESAAGSGSLFRPSEGASSCDAASGVC